MALSPWHLAQRLSCEELAALLGGYEITSVEAGNVRESQMHEQNEWLRIIKEAAQKGELTPYHVKEHVGYEGKEGDFSNPLWVGFDARHDFWKRLQHKEFKLRFERQEIYRWLKASGVADHDIPESLRTSPKPKGEPLDKPVNPRRQETYLKLIEALSLEVMKEIPDEPYKAAGILQTILEKHGLALNKEPIATTVKEILAAREERQP